MKQLDKGEGMIKELKEKLNKVFNNDQKEINKQVRETILKQLDNINYCYDKNLPVTTEDIETLKALNSVNLDNKKSTLELVEKVAKILGITVGAAATVVGIIFTVKGYDFDCEWMNRIFEMKDSLNVVDPNSRSQASKNRENHRKMAEHMMNNRIR